MEKKKKKKKKHEKIFTLFADIFTIEKVLFKIIFWHQIFICTQVSKFLMHILKTFGMQNGDMVIFFLRCFRKVRS